jgi:hypothetical protein
MSEPYVYRLNVLTSETTIWLGPDAFQVIEKGGATRTYSYGRVSRVRLSYEPSRVAADLYLCRIFVKGQSAPVATVSSIFYRGFLTFDPQLTAYRSFVVALHDKLSHRAGVQYRAGVSNFAYWGNAVFLTLVTVFSAILLIPIASGISLTGTHWFKIAMIAFLAPLAAAWFWSNRPRDYAPSKIPSELLPG